MPIVLVLALTTLTFTSSKGYRVAATLFAADLGAGPLQTGIIFALWGLFPFLLSVYAGRLADRFDNRVMMYWGLSGFSAGTGGLELRGVAEGHRLLHASVINQKAVAA